MAQEARRPDALPGDVRGLEGPWGCGHRPWETPLGGRRAELTGQEAASSRASRPPWPSSCRLPPPSTAWEPRGTEKGRCFIFTRTPLCALWLWEGREASCPSANSRRTPLCCGHSPTDLWVREDALGRGPALYQPLLCNTRLKPLRVAPQCPERSGTCRCRSRAGVGDGGQGIGGRHSRGLGRPTASPGSGARAAAGGRPGEPAVLPFAKCTRQVRARQSVRGAEPLGGRQTWACSAPRDTVEPFSAGPRVWDLLCAP